MRRRKTDSTPWEKPPPRSAGRDSTPSGVPSASWSPVFAKPPNSSRCESGRSSRSNTSSTFHACSFRRSDARRHQAYRSRRRSRRDRGRRYPALPRSPERLEDRPRQRFVPRCQTPRFRSPSHAGKPTICWPSNSFRTRVCPGRPSPGSTSPTATTTSSFSNGAATIRSTTPFRRAPREPMGVLAVEGFCRIQSVFHEHRDVFAPRTFPGCHQKDLRRAWQQSTRRLIGGLPRFVEQLSPAASRRPLPSISDGLSELLRFLEQASPLPGPTDYQARNIVINPATRTLRFIEFSKIGWDWPERRLTQYTTSHGAGRPDGRTCSALTPALTARYAALASEYRAASQAEIAALLDGHHFIFHLLAAQSLLDAQPDPRHPLLNRWRNPEARLAQLRRILETPPQRRPPHRGAQIQFRYADVKSSPTRSLPAKHAG